MKQLLPRLLFAAIFLLSSLPTANASFQADAPTAPAAPHSALDGGYAPDRLLVRLHPAFASQLSGAAGVSTNLQAFENLLPGTQLRAARPLFPAQIGPQAALATWGASTCWK
jgi:hypothetical protein